MEDQAKNLADVILAAVQLVLAVIGGVWVYFRFKKEITHHKRVTFDITAIFLGPQRNAWIGEFLLTVKNEGIVKHRFTKVELRVRGINQDAAITLWKETQRIEFPESIVKDDDVIYTKKYRSIFVEPGVTQKITYIARIPDDIRFISARAEFVYDGERTHSTERVFEVGSHKA